MKKNIGKTIFGIVTAIVTAALIWMFISWIDIVADNGQPNPTHHELNYFTVISKLY